MKLFFETALQMKFFLLMIPLGFIVCFLLDNGMTSVAFRFVLDLLVMILCGFCIVLYMLVLDETSIRFYHMLGLICGSILYMCGAARFRRGLAKRFRRWKAGISLFDAEEEDTPTVMKG